MLMITPGRCAARKERTARAGTQERAAQIDREDLVEVGGGHLHADLHPALDRFLGGDRTFRPPHVVDRDVGALLTQADGDRLADSPDSRGPDEAPGCGHYGGSPGAHAVCAGTWLPSGGEQYRDASAAPCPGTRSSAGSPGGRAGSHRAAPRSAPGPPRKASAAPWAAAAGPRAGGAA